jgi:lysophospholipase L1-like esterase
MAIHSHIISSSLLLFFLAGLVQVNASCSKPNAKPPIQQIDSITTPVTDTNSTYTYLALGDSYTIGQSIPENENYPEQAVTILNNSGFHFKAPDIIATTGWTTEDLLNAIANKTVPAPPYDIVTLLIGVNNQYQGLPPSEYKTQFTILLQKSIAFAGNRASHVIVISIPDYSVTPFGQQTGEADYIAGQIDSFNLINKQIAANYNVNYLNVTDSSRKAASDPTLIASDSLHFSGKEYAIWSSMLANIIEQIVK